jgi:predicted acyl esterase
VPVDLLEKHSAPVVLVEAGGVRWAVDAADRLPRPAGAEWLVTEYKIDLHANDHAFLKGHRIMVQIRAPGFRYDRNPQKFGGNIYKASDADHTEATQKVVRSKDAASPIVLPVEA